jgi:predicted nuclease of predicted toxin-antitoxin system
MRFLLDANMPRRAVSEIIALGHEAEHVRDIGFADASDEKIADHAKRNRLILITRDYDFADIRNYPPAQYSGIIVLNVPDTAKADFIVETLLLFLNEPDLLNTLPGRLAIVQPGRLRFWPR